MYQNKDNEMIMVTQCHYYAKVKKQKKKLIENCITLLGIAT